MTPSHLRAIGVIQNSVDGSTTSAPLYGTSGNSGPFDGDGNLAATDVLLKLTYFGDSNLDGKVDASDYSRIDNGYLTKATGWFNGDFNYGGSIDGSDYTLVDNAFNTQGAQILASIASSDAKQVASPKNRINQEDVVTSVNIKSGKAATASVLSNIFRSGSPITFAESTGETIEMSMRKKDLLDNLIITA